MTSPYALGEYIPEHYTLLHYVLREHVATHDRVALEFGVGSGTSTRLINKYMPVIGFDSFSGLPEDWRPGFPMGSFAQPALPLVGRDTTLIIGWFKDTLPDFMASRVSQCEVGLVHIDCDLYSSTKTVFDHIDTLIKPGCCIVFDEWHGYDGCEQFEQKAFKEYADRTGVQWDVLGHSFQQWAVQIV